jgi:hypothetical protein
MFVLSNAERSGGCKTQSIMSQVEGDSDSTRIMNSVQRPFIPQSNPTVGMKSHCFDEKRSWDEVVDLGIASSFLSLGPTTTNLTMRVYSLSTHFRLCYQHSEGLRWRITPTSHRWDSTIPVFHDYKLSDEDTERSVNQLGGNELRANSGDSEVDDIVSRACHGLVVEVVRPSSAIKGPLKTCIRLDCRSSTRRDTANHCRQGPLSHNTETPLFVIENVVVFVY